jgi:hypothetical protein
MLIAQHVQQSCITAIISAEHQIGSVGRHFKQTGLVDANGFDGTWNP